MPRKGKKWTNVKSWYQNFVGKEEISVKSSKEEVKLPE